MSKEVKYPFSLKGMMLSSPIITLGLYGNKTGSDLLTVRLYFRLYSDGKSP